MTVKTLCAGVLATAFALTACREAPQADTAAQPASAPLACEARHIKTWEVIYDDLEKNHLDIFMTGHQIDAVRARGLLRGRLMAQTLEVIHACNAGIEPRNLFSPR